MTTIFSLPADDHYTIFSLPTDDHYIQVANR